MASMEQVKQQSSNWAVPFFTIWIGQALSLIGSGLGGFALVWWLTDTTGSATVLAIASLVQILPGVILGPVAGALIDRWNRRRVMIVSDGIIALLSAWLAFLFYSGEVQIWHIYAIMFARSLGGTFHWAAMQASTSLMVPKEQLSRTAGMNQTLYGVLNIVSPPLGAFLMSVLEMHSIMTIDVLTAAFAIAPLFFIHIPQPAREDVQDASSSKPSVLSDVKEGFLYIWRWQGLFMCLLIATLLNLLVNPGFSLMPILVTRHFGGDAVQLAWMNSAWGIGVVAGGLTLSVWGGFRRRIHTSLLGLLGIGIGVLTIGFVPPTAFGLGLFGMFLAGFMNPIVNGPFFAIMQNVVAPEMQGRVFTAIGSISAGASPLGMAIAGPVADRFGVQVWFVAGGIAALLMGLGMSSVPAVMHLEDHQGATTEKPRQEVALEAIE